MRNNNKEITDDLAIQILNNGIERCKKSLISLEIGTEDYDNVYGEMQLYQMHKESLLRGGGGFD